MWFIQPKRDYVAEMPWQHADDPALMAWQIRTRDYNTFVANCIFIVWAVAFGSFLYLLVTKAAGANITDGIGVATMGLYVFMVPIAMSMTHQTSIIVYRLTEKHMEVISWKPQIDSVKPVLTWTAIVSGVGVLFLVVIDPAFLIAAIGPVGLGITAALMGTSKNYRSLVRADKHYEIDWTNAEEIAVWRKRSVIGLRFTYYNEDGSHYAGYKTLYCQRKDLNARIEFFQSRLPGTPYRECKLDVDSHFATLPK